MNAHAHHRLIGLFEQRAKAAVGFFELVEQQRALRPFERQLKAQPRGALVVDGIGAMAGSEPGDERRARVKVIGRRVPRALFERALAREQIQLGQADAILGRAALVELVDDRKQHRLDGTLTHRREQMTPDAAMQCLPLDR